MRHQSSEATTKCGTMLLLLMNDVCGKIGADFWCDMGKSGLFIQLEKLQRV